MVTDLLSEWTKIPICNKGTEEEFQATVRCGRYSGNISDGGTIDLKDPDNKNFSCLFLITQLLKGAPLGFIWQVREVCKRHKRHGVPQGGLTTKAQGWRPVQGYLRRVKQR